MTREEMELEIFNSKLAIDNLEYKKQGHMTKIRFFREEIMKLNDVSQS